MPGDLRALLVDLMLIPGLSGHEGRVRARLRGELDALALTHRTDRLGNLVATLEGDPAAPAVMLIAHMDQLGFVVRRIEPDGFLRLERLGGVPERALAAQAVTIAAADGRDLPGVILAKSHHATDPAEKHVVAPYRDLLVDAGFESAAQARRAGVDIGAAVVYAPRALPLAGARIAGTAVDDRAGCAVLVETARLLAAAPTRPTVHLVFSVQEEFNLRGALVAAQALRPDIAVQIDLMLASDTPDMEGRGEMRLGGGPGMSLHSFHGRGTLNGLIPHPALTALMERTAAATGTPLQRSAQTGILTETSYVQLVGEGVACLDMGFPMRASHSALEVCDLRDLDALARLLAAAVTAIGPGFDLIP